jgi:prolyl-tRNA synthetase
MSPLIEEVIHWLVRRETPSYKQLPLSLYWSSSTWYEVSSEDQISGFGHENQVFHLFHFTDSMTKLEELNHISRHLLMKFFQLCNLSLKTAPSLSSYLPQAKTTDYYYPSPSFGKAYCFCSTCNYQAAQTVATFRKDPPEQSEPLALEKVATPNASTIQALADFLNIPTSKTAKGSIFMGKIPPKNHETLIFAVLRGDLENQ